jgi:putative tryptophan/tyrosine transport system substrate-binding protein
MRRRTFLLWLSSIVWAPWSAGAQTSTAPPKIGYLHPATIDPDSPVIVTLRPRWRKLGYVEGETILLRSAQGDITRLPELVAELIARGVGVLIVVGPQAVRAARATTSTVPIVALDLETDPVKAGLIASWTKPGGNVTGLFLDQASLTGKWLELLREIAPLKRVALVWDPNTGSGQLDAAKNAASSLGIDAVVLEVSRIDGIDAALATLGTGSTTGVMLLGSPILVNPPRHFADAALKYKLPTVSYFKPVAKAGGLLTYGANQETYFPRSIVMAHEILNGTKPGDMPIERPDHYELVINLKAARTLGLNVPQTLQFAADEVIE